MGGMQRRHPERSDAQSKDHTLVVLIRGVIGKEKGRSAGRDLPFISFYAVTGSSKRAQRFGFLSACAFL
jgi:hypothetical protein